MPADQAITGSAVVVAVKTVTLALGATITYFALKAYRRAKSPALRALVVGFSLVTTGAVSGGLVHQLSGLSLQDAILIESLFIMFGFLVLTYSLYAETGS
jgi:uncharacterized membrane protein